MERWFPYSRVETSQEEIEVFDPHYSSFDNPGSIFLLSAKFISNDGKVLMSTHSFLLFYKFHEGHYWQGKCLFIVDLLCARPDSNCLWDVPPGSQSPRSMTLYLKEGSLFWGLGLAFVTVTIERMYRGKNTCAELFGSMILLFWKGAIHQPEGNWLLHGSPQCICLTESLACRRRAERRPWPLLSRNDFGVWERKPLVLTNRKSNTFEKQILYWKKKVGWVPVKNRGKTHLKVDSYIHLKRIGITILPPPQWLKFFF